MTKKEFNALKQADGKPMTWEELLEMRESVVGKDIQYLDPGNRILRGPIASFNLTDTRWLLELEWQAFLDGKNWKTLSDKSDALGIALAKAKGAKLEYANGIIFGLSGTKRVTTLVNLGEGRIRMIFGSGKHAILLTSGENMKRPAK